MKHVHHVASAPQQLLRRHCTRMMCLIRCINFLWMTSYFARFLAGRQPISALTILTIDRLFCCTIVFLLLVLCSDITHLIAYPTNIFIYQYNDIFRKIITKSYTKFRLSAFRPLPFRNASHSDRAKALATSKLEYCKTRIHTPRATAQPRVNSSLASNLRLRNDLYCVGWGVKLYSLTPRLQFSTLTTACRFTQNVQFDMDLCRCKIKIVLS